MHIETKRMRKKKDHSNSNLKKAKAAILIENTDCRIIASDKKG